MAEKIYQKIVELQQAGIPAILATVVRTTGSTPRKSGAKMIVASDKTYGTVGGGEQEFEVVEKARGLLKKGISENQVLEFVIEEERGSGLCGGTVEVFLESLIPAPKLYILGAGHVGSVLAKMAIFLDFSITIIDDRAELCNDELFPEGIMPLSGEFLSVIGELDFDLNTYVVIVTRGHQHDYEVLKACLKKDTKYIGMMGSEKKVAAVFRKLKEERFTDIDIAKVYAPIGLDIQNETPAEIAVSILAQIISVLRGGTSQIKT